jgi:hypothetical protein
MFGHGIGTHSGVAPTEEQLLPHCRKFLSASTGPNAGRKCFDHARENGVAGISVVRLFFKRRYFSITGEGE